jgi:flagellar biosynthesis protein FliR
MLLSIDEYAVSFLLVFCRVGCCLLQVPGLASARIPARVRLYFALTLSVVVTPVLTGEDLLKSMGVPKLLWVTFAEAVIGTSIGLASRIYIAALEFAAAAIANLIGLTGLGGGIEHEEPAAVLSNLITISATLFLLLSDMHALLITYLVNSYTTLPIGTAADTASVLKLTVDTLSVAFTLGIQICGPFIIYGIVVNLMFGILGKLVPQIPSYFISVPFLAIGGLVLLYFLSSEILFVFSRSIAAALLRL